MDCPNCGGKGSWCDNPGSAPYKQTYTTCSLCQGTGAVKRTWEKTERIECYNCKGRGTYKVRTPRTYRSGMPTGEYDESTVTCSRCGGAGYTKEIYTYADPDRTSYGRGGAKSGGCLLIIVCLSLATAGLATLLLS
jgi:DnaJ-class molecular chaperone